LGGFCDDDGDVGMIMGGVMFDDDGDVENVGR
jgi:hypothetical protein